MLRLTAYKSTEAHENQPLFLNLIQQPVSVTMENTWDNQLRRREGWFSLRISEVPSVVASLCCHQASVWRGQMAGSRQSGNPLISWKQKTEEGAWFPISWPRVHPQMPNAKSLPVRFHRLPLALQAHDRAQRTFEDMALLMGTAAHTVMSWNSRAWRTTRVDHTIQDNHERIGPLDPAEQTWARASECSPMALLSSQPQKRRH